MRRAGSALRNPAPTVFRPAPWAISFLLRKLGFHAVTLPNRKAYFLAEHYTDRSLRWHELAHLRQLQRHGQAFWLLYYWEMIRVGYHRNRFEIEANAYRRRQPNHLKK